MKTLKDGKISITMKEALIRNNIAEQNKQTAMKALQCVSNKEMASLKNKQAFYLKRQEQLKARSSSSVATRSLTPAGSSFSFQSMTELQTRPKSALVCSPSIEISSYDEPSSTQIKLPPLSPSGNGQLTTGSPMRPRSKSTSDISKEVAAFLKKPLNTDGAFLGRRTSLGEISDDIYMAKPRSLTLPVSASNTARSAPSSPVLPRKPFVDMPGTQLPNQRLGKGRRGSAAQPRTITIDNGESLENSMDKLKFCRYLRDGDKKLDTEDYLPDEVKPRALIIGHTKVL